MQPEKSDEPLLDRRLDDICEGLVEAIEREVETLRREGFPIYVEQDGQVVDLQQIEGKK